MTNGTCTELLDEAECLAAGGTFNGAFTLCADTLCCADPFADADGDGDVDQEDFGIFQACFTGTGGGVLPGCDCLDREPDLDVDDVDYGAFENCATGPGIPADPACD